MKHDMKDEVSGGPEAPSTSIAEVWGTDSMPRQCPGPLECVELCVEQEGLILTVNVDADLKRNQNYPLLYTGVLGGKNWMIIDAEGDNIRIRILKILEFNYSKYKVSFIKMGIGRQQPEIIEFETTEAVAEIRTAINPQVETIKLRIRVNLNMDL